MSTLHHKTQTPLHVRWGILGCSQIANDFCLAMKTCEGHELSAVASRSIERASKFATQFAIPKFYGSYKELLEDREIDVIYIANDPRDHFENAMKTLQSGKSVLCEKPLCMSWQQCSTLIQTAKEHRKLLIEGLWSLFLPTYDHLRRAINAGEIGEVQELNASIKLNLKPTQHVFRKDLGGGVSVGIGIYGLHLAALLFEGMPNVRAEAVLNEDGLDIKSKIFLEFENGKKAFIDSSLQGERSSVAIIKGKKGEISMEEFNRSDEIVVNGVTHSYPMPSGQTIYPLTMGYVHEITRAGEAWKRGFSQVEEVPLEISSRVYKIMDEVLKQINVTYPFPLDGIFSE